MNPQYDLFQRTIKRLGKIGVQALKIKMIYNKMPAKWQKEILKIVQEHSKKIGSALK